MTSRKYHAQPRPPPFLHPVTFGRVVAPPSLRPASQHAILRVTWLLQDLSIPEPTDVRQLSSVSLNRAQLRAGTPPRAIQSITSPARSADIRHRSGGGGGGGVFSPDRNDESVCPSDCGRRALIQRRGVVERLPARPAARHATATGRTRRVGSGPCSARVVRTQHPISRSREVVRIVV